MLETWLILVFLVIKFAVFGRAISFSGRSGFCRGRAPVPTLPCPEGQPRGPRAPTKNEIALLFLVKTELIIGQGRRKSYRYLSTIEFNVSSYKL